MKLIKALFALLIFALVFAGCAGESMPDTTAAAECSLTNAEEFSSFEELGGTWEYLGTLEKGNFLQDDDSLILYEDQGWNFVVIIPQQGTTDGCYYVDLDLYSVDSYIKVGPYVFYNNLDDDRVEVLGITPK